MACIEIPVQLYAGVDNGARACSVVEGKSCALISVWNLHVIAILPATANRDSKVELRVGSEARGREQYGQTKKRH